MHRGNDCEHLGEFLVRLDEFGNALVYLLVEIVVDLPFFAFASSLYLKLRFK